MPRIRILLAGGALLLGAVLLWGSMPWQQGSAAGARAVQVDISLRGEQEIVIAEPIQTKDPPQVALETRAPIDAEGSSASQAHSGLTVLEGRIVVPAGTPPDEHITVAIRTEGEANPWHFDVDSRYTFRATLDDSPQDVLVSLEAEHLYLALRLTHAERVQDLVLEPKLGARILGRVELPDGCAHWRDEIVDANVDLVWSDGECALSLGRTRLDERLGFQLNGVPIEPGLKVVVSAEPFSEVTTGGWGEDRLRLLPGQDRLVVLPLKMAAAVHGRIELESAGLSSGGLRDVVICVGQTAPGGEASLEYEFLGDLWRGAGRAEFRVGSLLNGSARVHVAAKGHIPVEMELEPFEDCEDRDLGTIVLDRGLTLTGRVVLEGGSQAACAVVLIDDPTAPPRPGLVPECADEYSHTGSYAMDVTGAVSDENGAFEVRGLGPGPWTLVAQHVDSVGVPRTSRVDQVRPSAGELLVVVKRPPLIHGVLSTSDGAPLSSYVQLGAECDEPALQGFRTAKLDSRTGHFEFPSLFPGRWKLTLRAEGFEEWHEAVELGSSDKELDVTLERVR